MKFTSNIFIKNIKNLMNFVPLLISYGKMFHHIRMDYFHLLSVIFVVACLIPPTADKTAIVKKIKFCQSKVGHMYIYFQQAKNSKICCFRKCQEFQENQLYSDQERQYQGQPTIQEFAYIYLSQKKGRQFVDGDDCCKLRF